jgi:hypothetical protein
MTLTIPIRRAGGSPGGQYVLGGLPAAGPAFSELGSWRRAG